VKLSVPLFLSFVCLVLAGCSTVTTRKVISLDRFHRIFVEQRMNDNHRLDELLPAEKMLAAINPGYKTLEVTCRLDSHLTNGSLRLVQYNADSPTGVAWADSLSELFYNSAPVKQFRKKHTLTKVGGKKYLLSALLAWASGPGFRSRAQFDEHYRKHGAEFGRITQEEYLRLAQALRDAPAGGACRHRSRASARDREPVSGRSDSDPASGRGLLQSG
jgi:hypothetical protein